MSMTVQNAVTAHPIGPANTDNHLVKAALAAIVKPLPVKNLAIALATTTSHL